MSKSFIWRIENQDGLGPYRDIKTLDVISRTLAHPNSIEDDLINRLNKKEEIFGFKDLKQVYKWFTQKELEKLYILGYTLRMIEVEEVTIGRHQVLARRKIESKIESTFK